MLGAGFKKFHKLFQKLLVMGREGHSNSTFYSVKLFAMINFSLHHLSFVVVLFSMYSLYAVIKMVLLDERGCHVLQELEAKVHSGSTDH